MKIVGMLRKKKQREDGRTKERLILKQTMKELDFGKRRRTHHQEAPTERMPSICKKISSCRDRKRDRER